jgi:hypothetical protein
MAQGKGFPAPLLPEREQGLGDEGKPAQSSVSPTFAEWIALKKGGTGLKVPLFKGDSGGSSLWLLVTGLLNHPLRLSFKLLSTSKH